MLGFYFTLSGVTSKYHSTTQSVTLDYSNITPLLRLPVLKGLAVLGLALYRDNISVVLEHRVQDLAGFGHLPGLSYN